MLFKIRFILYSPAGGAAAEIGTAIQWLTISIIVVIATATAIYPTHPTSTSSTTRCHIGAVTKVSHQHRGQGMGHYFTMSVLGEILGEIACAVRDASPCTSA